MKYNWTKSLFLLPLLGMSNTYGQAAFKTIEYLDINHFKVGHLVHGDMWYDPTTNESACEYPKGSGKQIGNLSTLWTVASDGSGKNDYAATQMYRGGGSDFWPGPLDAADTCTYATSEQWARIWKINQADINTFRALSSRTTITIPKNILEWPAKGNVYAKGNAEVSLSITENMAPFVDIDGDGVYDPIKGDYPQIKGDQMLWWIFNDNGATPHGLGRMPMKLEYRTSAYAYSRGGVLDNTVYYEFDIVNKSSVNYIDFRVGLSSDVDLGNPFDDYIASDSVCRMGITYNAEFSDNTHLVGLSIVEMPGDHYPGAMQLGVFSSYESSLTGPRRDPRTPSDFSNYMHAKNADGGPLGYYPYKVSGTYEFSLQDGITMCAAEEPPKDRRFYLNTGGFDFPAGSTKKMAMALMATDTTGNACGKLNFKELTDAADSAWKVYYNPLPPLGVKEIAALDQKLRIYPNPAESVLLIDSYMGKALKAAQLKVYDATGRSLQVPVSQSSKQISIDVSLLAAGVYSLVYSEGEVQATQQFIKK